MDKTDKERGGVGRTGYEGRREQMIVEKRENRAKTGAEGRGQTIRAERGREEDRKEME